MNLNENPRLENIEISEDRRLAEFFQTVADDVFAEVKPEENRSEMLKMVSLQESFKFHEIKASPIPRSNLHVPKTTHTIK
jgi:hypothetical protein